MSLSRDIEDAALAVGWGALYEEHFKNGELRPANGSGERSARSPFPYSHDNNPSYTVSEVTGLWRDFHAEIITGIKGGNFVQFIAAMYFFEQSPDGTMSFDWNAAERWVRARIGVGAQVDEGWLAHTRAAAAAGEDAPCHRSWRDRKPWSVAALVSLGIGWDERTCRLVFPFQDRQGKVANCRLYQPGGEPKVFWLNKGMTGNFLFPFSARSEEWVVLVEGEPDVVTLRTLGFNGCSGSMGSSQPLPGPTWWVGKTVFVWMDDDDAGRKAAAEAVAELQRTGAGEVRAVGPMPSWDGKPANADVSDWVVHMFRRGADTASVQRAVRAHLLESPQAETADAVWDSEPVDVEFQNVIRSHNAATRVRTNVRSLSVSQHLYRQVVGNEYTCCATGRRGCATCALALRWHGKAVISVDPRSEFALKLYGYTDEEVDRSIRREYGIDERCPVPRRRVLTAVDAQPAVLGQTLDDGMEAEGVFAESPKIESIFLLRKGVVVLPNVDYQIEAFVHPHPKTQKQIIVVDSAKRLATSAETFRMTPEIAQALSIFRQGPLTVLSKLGDVADDVSLATTGIVGRRDLHLMYRTVWHSVIAFIFGGRRYERGWIEAIVIGDTRCGKSAAFRAMSKFYGTGVLVDCKMQSYAGILGAVETSQLTGERYVIPGVMPRQDGRGPICFDEFTSRSWDKNPMIEVMSSTRAEGMVNVVKAATATFPARVGQVWLCNPGVGKLMRDIGGHAVEMIGRIIRQPEDIARFDIGMAVGQDEVGVDVLNSIAVPAAPRYPREASRLLIAWARSRKPEQVNFTKEAEGAVLEEARAMFHKYDAAIPLVEPADQRHRVAKVAVSVAVQLFSSTEDGEGVVVRVEHVLAAAALFKVCYDKPLMGYDVFSSASRRERVLVDEAQVAQMLNERIKAGGHVVFAQKLLRLQAFSERTLTSLAPINHTDAHYVIQMLSANRCIEPDGLSFKEMWTKTPQFVNFLERYIQWAQAQASPGPGPGQGV